MCVYEREGDTKERGRREREREGDRERGRELDSVCVCVCVWQGLQYTSCSTQVTVYTQVAVQRWCLLTAHSMV